MMLVEIIALDEEISRLEYLEFLFLKRSFYTYFSVSRFRKTRS